MDLLNQVKLIIFKSLSNNVCFDNLKVYAFSNENIKDYLELLDLSKCNKVLSICSSGDHLFNLSLKGIENIDLIDTNPLTEYYSLGFRIAMIKAFNYENYLRVLHMLFKDKNLDLETEKNLLLIILNFMDEKYKLFWEEVFNYYFSLQYKYQKNINLFQILTLDYYFNLDEIKFYNNYLLSEKEYVRLKDAFKGLNISFRQESIFNINDMNIYDLILCSNVLEHTYKPNLSMVNLRDEYINLINSLTRYGIMLSTYIYDFYNMIDENFRDYPIGGIDITARELLKEELLLFPSYCGKSKDAILILRK